MGVISNIKLKGWGWKEMPVLLMKKHRSKGGKYILFKNIFNQVKITTLIMSILVLTTISMSYITYSSLNRMSILSGDMNNLYRNEMGSSIDLLQIETDFYNIRLNMANMVYSKQYNRSAEEKIETIKKSIGVKLEKYKNLNLTSEERAVFEKVDTNFNNYINGASTIINQLKLGKDVHESKITELISYSTEAQLNIDELVSLNEQNAKNVVEDANLLYENSKNKFIAISFIITFLMIVITFGLYRFLKSSMAQINNVLDGLKNYDFTVELDDNGKNEFSEMNRSISHVITNIKKALLEVKNQSQEVTSQSQNLAAVSEEMSSSSQELASTMQQVAEGATNQANDLTEIVNSLSELTHNIENVYKKLESVKEESEKTEEKANLGKIEMDLLVNSIKEIRNSFDIVINKVENLTQSVKEINGITEMISGISDQTNLLALNASIEAARAGEHGRGFAVVAEEVRNLAEESRKSTEKIVNLLSSVTLDAEEVLSTSKTVNIAVKNQADSVEKTVTSFGDIITSVEIIAPLMKDTYNAMDQIKESKDIVMERIEMVSSVTEENSAATEEVAASSEELTASTEEVASTAESLSSISEDLMKTVGRFKV